MRGGRGGGREEESEGEEDEATVGIGFRHQNLPECGWLRMVALLSAHVFGIFMAWANVIR
jgi:hypothetical protein